MPDHPAIREAEMYGWPGLDDMQDDEIPIMFDDEVDGYDKFAGLAGLEI